MDQKLDGTILLVCGPPASGKDTLTGRLLKKDKRFLHFLKHRGINEVPNNLASSQYINISKTKFENLINQDEFLQFHLRYERYYGISKSILKNNIVDGKIPIIHVGRLENLKELENKLNKNAKVIKLLIWAPLPVLEQRLKKRHSEDQVEIERRLKAAKEEFNDLITIELHKTFDFLFKNDQTLKTAEQNLYNLLQHHRTSDDGVKQLEQYLFELYK